MNYFNVFYIVLTSKIFKEDGIIYLSKVNLIMFKISIILNNIKCIPVGT